MEATGFTGGAYSFKRGWGPNHNTVEATGTNVIIDLGATRSWCPVE